MITFSCMNASTVFPIIPAAGKSLWFLAIIALVLVLGAVLMGYIAWSTRHVTCTVSPAGLRIQGDMYGRLIPLQSLMLDKAAATNLTKYKEHQAKWRTNGVGLPGYASGWFKLRNGEKGLLFVTDPTRVARIPTTEGYTVMLSVSDPAALIDALRQQHVP
jgi:hypothetical protein